MLKQISFVVLSGGFLCSGCSRTPPASSSLPQSRVPQAGTPVSPASTTATQATRSGTTGNAPTSRDQSRAMNHEVDGKLLPKDHKGAMDARLKMLTAQSQKSAPFAAPDFYTVQSLALADLPKVAARLNAASCRAYAAQLKALDARVPPYSIVLQQEKAEQISNLARRQKNPKFWQSIISGLGRNPQEKQALQRMSAAQIEVNITKIYDAAIASFARPYSGQEIKVAVDPYTRSLASPSSMGRFLWTKFKTDRLLAIVALENKADALEHKPQIRPLPADPFGTDPFKRKNKQIYSVGPDTKDDGGKPLPRPKYVDPSDKGDIFAPTL